MLGMIAIEKYNSAIEAEKLAHLSAVLVSDVS